MYGENIPMEINITFAHEIGRQNSIYIHSKQKYKVTTFVCNLLSLQETPLGCSSRMPGNLQCFWGFLIWIKSGDLYDLPLLGHA